MFNAFLTLFTGADWLFYVLLVLAIGLFVAELLIPSFGLTGLGGILLTVSAITQRCTHGKNTANEILCYIVYIILLVIVVVFTTRAIIIAVKKKSKVKYATVDGNKIPLTKEGNLDYSFLIGSEGEVITDLKPTGKVRFEQGTFEVTSTKEYIYAGAWVRADRIFNGRIIVRKK